MSQKSHWFGFLSSVSQNITVIVNLLILLFILGGCMLFCSSVTGRSSFSSIRDVVHQDSILVLRLEGLIIDSSEILEDLHEYMGNKKIKGVLIRVDSPGGTTSASQEIYNEIHRLKAIHKKPVVMSIGSLGASGAFYISMAGDKIVANEATLMGSIGVVIYLTNLERLYEWAKVENYVLKTGEFKDAGSQFRPLTNRERDLFQDLMDQFLDHFKEVIIKDRKLSTELVEEFADGRVFSGETALLQGFIDQTGTYYEALNLIGEMTGLGTDPEVFEPVKKVDRWVELFNASLRSLFPWFQQSLFIKQELKARPLYLLPETIGLSK
ncbi:MAG: signal peptide peptidase SppA [Bdellovibrionales bacterium]|nr:signal peptide peptidase SppA [Bdellovibrionales bacterium]